MKNKLKRFTMLTAIVAVLAVGFSVLAEQSAFAAFDTAKESATQGACFGSSCTADSGSIDNVIKMVIDVLSVLVGVLAVIMIIVAGFKYITSSGDGQKVSSAKTTMIYAIIGLIIVALAQTIVFFVLGGAIGETTIGGAGGA